MSEKKAKDDQLTKEELGIVDKIFEHTGKTKDVTTEKIQLLHTILDLAKELDIDVKLKDLKGKSPQQFIEELNQQIRERKKKRIRASAPMIDNITKREKFNENNFKMLPEKIKNKIFNRDGTIKKDFTYIDAKGREQQLAFDPVTAINEKGEGIVLTDTQYNIVYAVYEIVQDNNHLTKKGIINQIDRAGDPVNMEVSLITKGNKVIPTQGDIKTPTTKITIPVYELAKKIRPGKSIGKGDYDRIKKDLDEMIRPENYHLMSWAITPKNKTSIQIIREYEPLFTFKVLTTEEVNILKGKGENPKNLMAITLHPVWAYNIQNVYVEIPTLGEVRRFSKTKRISAVTHATIFAICQQATYKLNRNKKWFEIGEHLLINRVAPNLIRKDGKIKPERKPRIKKHLNNAFFILEKTNVIKSCSARTSKAGERIFRFTLPD